MARKDFIKVLKDKLERNSDLEDIIIFGSAARTNFQKFNDVDVLIIYKNDADLSEMPSSLKDIEELYDVKINPLLDYGTKNPAFNYGGFKPILNYFSAKNKEIIFNYIKGKNPKFNYQSALLPKSKIEGDLNYIENKTNPYHIFYCKEKDLKLKDDLGRKVVREKISIKELNYALV